MASPAEADGYEWSRRSGERSERFAETDPLSPPNPKSGFLSILAETNKRTILAARQAHLLLLAKNSGDSDEPPAASSISECYLPDYDELKVVTLLSIIRSSGVSRSLFEV